MRTYMSKYMTTGNSYKKRVLYPVIAIYVFMMAGAVGTGILIAENGGVESLWMQWMITILLILAVAAVSAFLMRIGKNAHRDAFVFCIDDSENLYAVDARECVRSARGRWGTGARLAYKFFATMTQTGNLLKKIKEEHLLEEEMQTGRIRTYADTIRNVKTLKLAAAGKYAVCEVVTCQGVKKTRKYDLTNHPEELLELFLHASLTGEWETVQKTYRKQILISLAFLLLDLGLCIGSYPAVGLLPVGMYFPCLFALCIPGIAMGTFILKSRRGE